MDGFEHAGASSTVLECTVPYAKEAMVEALGGSAPEKYASEEAAVSLARAARIRAAVLMGRRSKTLEAYADAVKRGERMVGVGATGALATTRERRGTDRAYVAVDCDNRTVVHSIVFEKGAYDRQHQDAVVSFLVVRALAEACGDSFESLHVDLDALKMKAERRVLRDTAASMYDSFLSGAASTLTRMSVGDRNIEVADVPWAAFKAAPVILCGSFNPLHKGHILARSRVRAAGRFSQRGSV